MIYHENKNRHVFNIDFDGTLTTGEYTNDPGPVMPIINRVRDLYCSGHIIIIWTARWWENAPDMVSWLIKHRVPFHGVMMGKGGSDAYVDDKAVSWEDGEVQEWR
jgi:hypothetical protein